MTRCAYGPWGSRSLEGVRIHSTGNKAYSLLLFLAVSVLSGVLVAGLAVPLAAVAAGVTRDMAVALRSVPTDLAIPQQNEGSVLLMADGSALTTFYDENREYVPLDQIAPVMQQAQIAIEDHRFYEHGAIDVQSVVRAALGNLAGGDISGGGSTLTQQYIKQTRIQICNGEETCEAEAQAPTMKRKILEMRYSIALERQLTKDEILERYLNIAYYGDGAYGVQAAARHYFNKNAIDLTLAEAAMLAGLVQNPGQSDPVNNLDAALERRQAVLDAMVRYQGLSQEDADEAAQAGFDPSQVQYTQNGCPGSRYPFICDYAERILTSEQMPALGSDSESRMRTLRRAGLTITLHIDPWHQDVAQEAVSSVVGPEDAAIAVADVVDPTTGYIVAMAQSRPEWGEGPGQTAYNYSVANQWGGDDGFAFGSTFKTWTAAAAIQQGHFPDTTYFSVRKTQNWQGQIFRGCGDDDAFPSGPYTTTNAVGGQDKGSFNMVTGMMWSVNNYFIELEKKVGPCAAVDMARRAGVELALPVADENGMGDELTDWNYIPSFTLGSPMVTPLSMATGYGTFANRGVRCNPILLASVVNRDGQELPVPSADCQQVIDPAVADGVNYVLHRTHVSGLSSSVQVYNNIDQASKTGTSDNAVSASAFVGYTPTLSAAVIVGGDKANQNWINTPPQARNVLSIPLTPLGGIGLGGRYPGHSGIMWTPIMKAYMDGQPEAHFSPWVAPGR